jgi:hypothetical protein
VQVHQRITGQQRQCSGRPLAKVSPGNLPATRTPSRPAARKTLQP